MGDSEPLLDLQVISEGVRSVLPGKFLTLSRETCRKLHPHQQDLEHRRSSTVQCLELHIDLFVNIVNKLDVDDQSRWESHGDYGLTENPPVAQILSFLRKPIPRIPSRRNNSKETICP